MGCFLSPSESKLLLLKFATLQLSLLNGEHSATHSWRILQQAVPRHLGPPEVVLLDSGAEQKECVCEDKRSP